MEEKSIRSGVEALLAAGQAVQLSPIGWSMYPLIVNGRDQVVIEPADASSLRRGDVALYRRDGGKLVLHRVLRVRGEGFYMVGDNQREVEGPLRPDQIRGVMTAVIRRGRTVSVRSPLYRAACGLWLLLRPVRPALSRAAAAVKRLVRLR